MKLGLLGPAAGQLNDLGQAGKALRALGAERVIYLGADAALDEVVRDWAQTLVGPSAEDATLMSRATQACLRAEPAAIISFIEQERERAALRMFESLPSQSTRSVEMMGGKVAVLLYDKARLVEDDILPATLLVFGKSEQPLVKQVGRRWFLSPGSFPNHGVMMLEEIDGEIRAHRFNRRLLVEETRILGAPQSLKMRALGAS